MCADCSVLGQVLDRRREVEAVRKEFSCSGKHQFITLPNGDVSDARDVGDLALRLLVARRLRRHVDGRCRHRDGRPSGDDVEVDGSLGDVRRSFLDLPGETERSAEPVHEVSGLDDVDVGVMRLQDQLEHAPDLLLADGAHGHDLLQRGHKNELGELAWNQ